MNSSKFVGRGVIKTPVKETPLTHKQIANARVAETARRAKERLDAIKRSEAYRQSLIAAGTIKPVAA